MAQCGSPCAIWEKFFRAASYSNECSRDMARSNDLTNLAPAAHLEAYFAQRLVRPHNTGDGNVIVRVSCRVCRGHEQIWQEEFSRLLCS